MSEILTRFVSSADFAGKIEILDRCDVIFIASEAQDGRAELSYHKKTYAIDVITVSGDFGCFLRTFAIITGAIAASGETAGSIEVKFRESVDIDVKISMERQGLLVKYDSQWKCWPSLIMQNPYPWMGGYMNTSAFPQTYVLTGRCRHPLRPPKVNGILYRRYLPTLGRTFFIRSLEVESDLDKVHLWMNNPRVSKSWKEDGPREKQLQYLTSLRNDPHTISLIGGFDQEDFAYFEVYWAKEDRLGAHYDASDYDRGLHILVGEDKFQGKDYIDAWFPSLLHCIFLWDMKTQNIVGEPAITNPAFIRKLVSFGFCHMRTFDFPHKRAALITISRDKFFSDRLWLPARQRLYDQN